MTLCNTVCICFQTSINLLLPIQILKINFFFCFCKLIYFNFQSRSHFVPDPFCADFNFCQYPNTSLAFFHFLSPRLILILILSINSSADLFIFIYLHIYLSSLSVFLPHDPFHHSLIKAASIIISKNLCSTSSHIRRKHRLLYKHVSNGIKIAGKSESN